MKGPAKKRIWKWVTGLGVIVSIIAGIVTVAESFAGRIQSSEDNRHEELKQEIMTNASDVVKHVSEEPRKGTVEKNVIHHTSANQQKDKEKIRYWTATVKVSGAKNTVTFIESNNNVGVPKEISGVKTSKVVPISPSCLLHIQVTGTKNSIIVDEKLRGRVTFSGNGVKGNVLWKQIAN